MISSTRLAHLSYLTVCIVWGSTYLAIRIGVGDMPFIMFTGLRFTIAGLLILTVSLLCRWSFPKSRQDYKTLIFIGLLLLLACNGLISWAQQYLESSFTALLVASVPLFMAAVENLSPGGPRAGRLVWVGLVIGFGGVAVLVSPQLNLEKSSFPAVLAVLAASLLWSVGSILMKRNPVNSALMPSVGLQMLSAGSVFLLIAAITGDFSLAEASFSGYAALIYLIFIGSILAYSAFFYMIKFIPMAKAGTYAYINPVVAIVLGSLILNETLTAQKIMAAGVIIFGVVLVQRSKVSTKTALMAEEEVPAKRSLNWNIFPQKRKEE